MIMFYLLVVGYSWYNALVASMFGQTIIPGFKLLHKAITLLFALLVIEVALVIAGYEFGIFLKLHLKGTERWVAIVTIILIVIRMTYDFRNNIWREQIEQNSGANPTLYASLLSVTYALDLGCCACWFSFELITVVKVYIGVSIFFIVLGFLIGYRRLTTFGYVVYQVATFLLFLAAIIAMF